MRDDAKKVLITGGDGVPNNLMPFIAQTARLWNKLNELHKVR